MKHPSGEELQNSEDARLELAMTRLGEWSDLHEKMNTDYIGKLSGLHQERREMFKYIGTVGAGAAALAPQMLDEVRQATYFYWGIGLLCLVVAITVIYILSSLENEAGDLSKDLREKNKRIDEVRKPWVEFLSGQDYSVKALAEASSTAMTEGNNFVANMKEDKREEWFPRMDYTGEFVIFFFIGGLSLLVISLTNLHLDWKPILGGVIITFVIINIISTFPTRVFWTFGLPVDVIKWAIRWIFRKN